eukprot:SAG31_NODE_1109_length_9860_cov_22.119353_8_plen_541_part_00
MLLLPAGLFLPLVLSDAPPPRKRNASQCVGGPCGPGREQCGPVFPVMPRFHIKDVSCDENDPNGPFYDPVHGMYHLFFQDHLASPGGNGPVWGHVASRNLSHWARLPVAIWNGPAAWDSNAIFTGSVTIVNGRPVIVYSGRGPKGGYCTATPANGSDPLYKVWSKTDWAANPVMNGDDDPSTAWKTKHGEWRLTGNGNPRHSTRSCSPRGGGCAPIYASSDFKNWSFVGHTNLPVSECPSLFPLPPLAPGTQASPDQPLPTHVHKWARWHQFGRWIDGTPGVGDGLAGLWTTMRGATVNISNCGRYSNAQTDDQCQLYDQGAFYAAKDFWDPVQRRRINWGWAKTPHGAQTMPRSMTYHPQLEQLVYSPLNESAALRVLPPLVEVRGVRVNSSAPYLLGSFGARAGSSELWAFVRRPVSAAVITIGIGGVRASISCGPSDSTATAISNASVAGCTGCLRLLPTDKTLELRLFVDQTVAESYYQGGRVAYTSSVRSVDLNADAFISSNTSIIVLNATAWQMGDQWISEAELLATPRVHTAD